MSSTMTAAAAESVPAKPSMVVRGGALPLGPQVQQFRGNIPNTQFAVSFISAVLGAVFLTSLSWACRPYVERLGTLTSIWATPQLGLYFAALGAHHLSEFWTTAYWNPQKLSVDSFLLNNMSGYWQAHGFALAEYTISRYVFPGKYDSFITDPYWIAFSLAILVAGQSMRSLAMIHAANSFSHVVKHVKHDDHVLITHGVYSISRHPSYAGFFYWAIATQLLLGNPVSVVGFAMVLYRFFSTRIDDEEKHLIRFFGDDYVQYRKRVGTGLPF